MSTVYDPFEWGSRWPPAPQSHPPPKPPEGIRPRSSRRSTGPVRHRWQALWARVAACTRLFDEGLGWAWRRRVASAGDDPPGVALSRLKILPRVGELFCSEWWRAGETPAVQSVRVAAQLDLLRVADRDSDRPGQGFRRRRRTIGKIDAVGGVGKTRRRPGRSLGGGRRGRPRLSGGGRHGRRRGRCPAVAIGVRGVGGSRWWWERCRSGRALRTGAAIGGEPHDHGDTDSHDEADDTVGDAGAPAEPNSHSSPPPPENTVTAKDPGVGDGSLAQPTARGLPVRARDVGRDVMCLPAQPSVAILAVWRFVLYEVDAEQTRSGSCATGRRPARSCGLT